MMITSSFVATIQYIIRGANKKAADKSNGYIYRRVRQFFSSSSSLCFQNDKHKLKQCRDYKKNSVWFEFRMSNGSGCGLFVGVCIKNGACRKFGSCLAARDCLSARRSFHLLSRLHQSTQWTAKAHDNITNKRAIDAVLLTNLPTNLCHAEDIDDRNKRGQSTQHTAFPHRLGILSKRITRAKPSNDACSAVIEAPK